MATNPVPQTTQDTAASAEDILKKIVVSEQAAGVTKEVLIEGKKMSNYYLRKFVRNLQTQKMDTEKMLKTILIMDELIEKGKVNPQMLKDLEDGHGN